MGAALLYQQSQDGRDAVGAASLSANTLAELTVSTVSAYCPPVGLAKMTQVARRLGSNLGMRTRWSGLTVDCVDPARLAAFWGALLDRDPEPGLPGWAQLAARHDHEPRINFQPVPEPKRGKVRIHLDVTVDDIDMATDRVLALGGRDTGERYEYPEGTVVVLNDPEGNEFCIVQYRTSSSAAR